MRLTKEQVAINRQKILDSAARLFRLHGIQAVSLVDVTKEAGFTHGGFYNHFESKEALVEEVYKLAMTSTVSQMELLFKEDDEPQVCFTKLQMSIDGYLASDGSDDLMPNNGGLAMLAMEATQQGRGVQAQFAHGLAQIVTLLIHVLMKLEPHGVMVEKVARGKAMLLLSGSLGALVIARSMVHGDPVLADEFLVTGRERLLMAVLELAAPLVL